MGSYEQLLSLSSESILLLLKRVVSSISDGVGLGNSSPVHIHFEDIRAEVKPDKLKLNHFLQTKECL